MTQPTPYQRYDFAAAARVERPLWTAMNNWMLDSAELFTENWLDFSSTQIGAVPSIIDAQTFGALQESWTAPMLAVPVSAPNEPELGMLVASRTELLVLLMDILGGSSETESDRELTSVEVSLSKLILEQCCVCLGHGWQKQQPLELTVGEIDQTPNRSRMFPLEELLMTSGLSIQVGDKETSVNCIWVKSRIQRLLDVDLTKKDNPNPNVEISLDSLAEVEVELRAWFGSAEISVDELATITSGDILVLDQPIERPLEVTANEEPAFVAWPGRQQNLQVLKLASKRHNS